MSTTADDLRAAATYIRAHGWTRGVTQKPDGSVCAIGGINAVTGGYFFLGEIAEFGPGYADAVTAMERYLLATGDSDRLTIPYWNDNHANDGEEVTAAMEKAAAWIEEQG